MTDASNNAFEYGHPGRLQYLVERREWVSTRDLVLQEPLHATPRRDHSDAYPQEKALSASKRNASIRELLKAFPVLQPAGDVIAQCLKGNAQTPTSEHESLLGHRLIIVSSDHKPGGPGRRTANDKQHAVLVYPSGSYGQEVHFKILQLAQAKWKGSEIRSAEMWDFAGVDEVIWTGDATGVRQICCAGSASAMKAVAVRTEKVISIFHCKDWTTTKTDTWLSKATPTMVVDLKSLVRDGYQCTDIVFDPEDDSQLGVIDAQGNWALWKLKVGEKPQIVARSPREPRPSTSDSTGTHNEAWYRIFWLTAGNVVTCSRTQIQLFNLRGKLMRAWSSEENKLSGDILDCCRSGTGEHTLLVLNSSHILVLEIRTGDEAEFHWVASWRHSRDSFDDTLQLSNVSFGKDEAIVLYSRHRQLMTQYVFGRGVSGIVYTRDPQILEWDVRSVGELLLVKIGTAAEESQENARQCMAQMVGLSSEFEITHTTFRLNSTGALMPLGSPMTITTKKVAERGSKTRKRRSSFIVDSEEPDFAVDPLRSVSNSRTTDAFTVPHELVYEAVTNVANELELSALLDDLLKGVVADGRDQGRHQGHQHTLRESYSDTIGIGNLDRASATSLSVFRQTDALAHEYKERRCDSLGSAQALGMAECGMAKIDLGMMYSHLVANWIRAVPPTAPSGTRMWKEKVVRVTVAALFLASLAWTSGEARSAAVEHEEAGDTQPGERAKDSLVGAVGRLRRYTDFRELPSGRTGTQLTWVLRHWEVGADPYRYDHARAETETRGDIEPVGRKASQAPRTRAAVSASAASQFVTEGNVQAMSGAGASSQLSVQQGGGHRRGMKRKAGFN